MFKSIEKEAEGIIVEKKSKFIANIYYVEGEVRTYSTQKFFNRFAPKQDKFLSTRLV